MPVSPATKHVTKRCINNTRCKYSTRKNLSLFLFLYYFVIAVQKSARWGSSYLWPSTLRIVASTIPGANIRLEIFFHERCSWRPATKRVIRCEHSTRTHIFHDPGSQRRARAGPCRPQPSMILNAGTIQEHVRPLWFSTCFFFPSDFNYYSEFFQFRCFFLSFFPLNAT